MKRNEFFKQISKYKMPDIEQVRENCINQNIAGISAGNANNIKSKKRQSWRKASIIVAATSLLIFSVSAMDGIRNLIFPGFNVTQVEWLSSPPPESERREGGGVTVSQWSFDIKDPEVEQNLDWYNPALEIDTIEEAMQYLAFNPSEFDYLPEDYVFDNIKIYNKNRCNIWYKKYMGYDGFYRDLALTAEYVGENATMEVKTIYDIEKIMLNSGIEALLMTPEHSEYYEIAWIKNGIGYKFLVVADRDEAIKMAESVK